MRLSSYSLAFGFAVLAFALGLFFVSLRLIRRARGVARAASVDHFLNQLTVVDRSKLDTVAAPLLSGHSDCTLECSQVWDLVGGIEGLAKLSSNCDVLIDMVCYIQQWYPEALPVAEQLRLHAREIRWHLERLRGAESRGHLQRVFPDYAQRAVAIYCAMADHVVAVYESCQAPGFQVLKAAL